MPEREKKNENKLGRFGTESVNCVAIVRTLLKLKTGTRARCYKTFFVCNLQIFAISQSVCPWQAFPA